MIRHLFDRKPGYEAEILAEAQALLDDGLDLDFVLGLFPDEADWLSGMLEVTTGIQQAYDGEQPSYYFEASLKARFLAAAQEPRPAPVVVLPAPQFSPARTAVASLSVAGAAAAVGVLALGFVTAGDSVPGDWNYTFKLANERLEYTLSRGDSRVDVQLRQAEERVFELQRLSEKGNASAEQVERLQREIDALRVLAAQQEFDEYQKARVEGVGRVGTTVLEELKKQPDIDPARVDAAAAAITDTVNKVREIPSPTPTATPSPTATPEPTVSPTATASPSESPTPTATPSPTETPTPTPTATETPSATAEPSPTATSTEAPVESETPTPGVTAAP